MEDIIAVFGEILKLGAGQQRRHSARIYFIYRILHVCVDHVIGNTIPYRKVGFESSMQDTNAKLLVPSATAL